MIKKIMTTLAMLLLLTSTSPSAFASTSFNTNALNFTQVLNFDSTLQESYTFSVKKDVPYDESKDPALRRGTENWDQPQGSFFVMPAFIFGLVLVFLFFSREK